MGEKKLFYCWYEIFLNLVYPHLNKKRLTLFLKFMVINHVRLVELFAYEGGW